MLGGLALFLYGMSIMSETLSRLTGGSLDRVIGRVTKNRYLGFATGTALTGLVQSSSATTVLAVGFVNAGIMTLKESFGFIVGASLGATANAWLLSLNSVRGGTLFLEICRPAFFVPVFAVVSIVLLMTSKKEKVKSIAQALIGEMISIFENMGADNRHFSEYAQRDIFIFEEAVREIVDTAVADLEQGNLSLSESIELFRQQVSEFHGVINSKHVKRLHDGICDRQNSIPFMDICYGFERIIDSCDMIAHNLKPFQKQDLPDDPEEEKKREKRREYISSLFGDKYMDLLN